MVLAHQPGSPLAVDRVSEAAQFGMHPRSAVVPAVFGVDLADLFHQGILVGLTGGPRIGAGDPPGSSRSGTLPVPGISA
ncbi:hypothetical protein GCM10010207_78510 [Streptomyces atratus]|nr:hypothetical protein GCM10010207_78510 [Streptomyces atratus]